jgi:hypothetical protein
MRGREKELFLREMKVDFDVIPFQKYLGELTEKELFRLQRKKKSLLKKNTLFIRHIKDIIEYQLFFIEKQLYWIGAI